MKDEIILKLLQGTLENIHLALQFLYSRGVSKMVEFFELHGKIHFTDGNYVKILSRKSFLLEWKATGQYKWASFHNEEVVIYVGHRILIYPAPQTEGDINYKL